MDKNTLYSEELDLLILCIAEKCAKAMKDDAPIIEKAGLGALYGKLTEMRKTSIGMLAS